MFSNNKKICFPQQTNRKMILLLVSTEMPACVSAKRSRKPEKTKTKCFTLVDVAKCPHKLSLTFQVQDQQEQKSE